MILMSALKKWIPTATSASTFVVLIVATREARAMGDEVGRMLFAALAIAVASAAWRWAPRRRDHAAPHRWPSPSTAVILAAWITAGVAPALAVAIVTWASEANRRAHQ